MKATTRLSFLTTFVRPFFCLSFGLVFSLSLSLSSALSHGAENSLHTKPNRCVALRQGQVCYQKIRLSWSTPAHSSYCLYEKDQEQALACWDGNKLSQYTYAFKSPESIQFEIISGSIVIASSAVKVSWVYQSRKRESSNWRLF
ncbi:MAG: hypothetical protein ACI93R_001027 [Flavobacteriales bacterium]|jgi:hypothetical protein